MEKNNEKDAIIVAPKTTKAQIIGVIFFAVAILAVFAVLTTVFILNFNKTYPDAVRFIDNNGHIYCSAEANDSFYGYRFKFDDGEKVYTFDHDDSLLEVNNLEGIKVGTTYKVTVCYLGEFEGGNSEDSKPVTWQAYTYLDTPVLSIENDKISWNAVTGADYYYVYYSSTSLDYIKVANPEISFSKLPAGVIDISVVAKSDYSYLKTCRLPAKTRVTVRKELKSFTSVSLSTQNYLTITGTELVDRIEILISGQVYYSSDFTVTSTSGGYTFKVDISAVRGTSSDIGVRPSSTNNYIFYNGDYIYVS